MHKTLIVLDKKDTANLNAVYRRGIYRKLKTIKTLADLEEYWFKSKLCILMDSCPPPPSPAASPASILASDPALTAPTALATDDDPSTPLPKEKAAVLKTFKAMHVKGVV